ncbi:MAG TPA: VWA domain-containing protein [Kineosporiaceae bacterium]|nr:VWA domain-containing protein [Kineosporiaceae bacterium]
MVEASARRAARQRRSIGGLLAAALVVALVGGGVVAVRSGLAGTAAAHLPWSSQPAPCGSTDVKVVVAPDAVTVVDQILAPLDGHVLPDGSCLRVDIQGQPPARSVSGAADGSTGAPQVWVPDSTLWAQQMTRWTMRPVGSLGTSPVVIAGTPATIARLGWSTREPSWPEALSPDLRLAAPPLTDDAAPLLGMLALYSSLGGTTEAEQAVAGLVLAAARTPTADLSAAAVLARGKGRGAPVLLASKHAVAQLNLDPTTPDLQTVQPTGLPAVLDYPVLRVGGPTDDPVVSAGADLVASTLVSPAAERLAAAATFGPPSRTVAPSTPQGRAAAAAVAAKVGAFVTQVRMQALPTRMLILMDVSRSMAQPVRPGLSRSRLAVQAALGAGRLLPDASAIGLWRFAGRQPQGRPYDEVAPVAELGSLNGGSSHRDVVNSSLSRLPLGLTAGGTALYDSTLAAVRQLRKSYDPSATNAVVVFTDGANDYPSGIDLRTFQAAVRADARAHPRQPIVLVVIGIGPAADMTALRAMAAPVGGRAYRADDARALRNVLFDAIAHRTPNAPS